MTILSGQSIRRHHIFDPFYERTFTEGGLSYGLGPASYDVRVEFDSEGEQDSVIVPTGGFVLASTMERIRMPNHLMAIAHDKSTWARRGIALQNTVIDPGWEGYLTLEITNHSSIGVVLERGDPIAQLVFHQLDESAEFPYDGKYQHQRRGPVRPR